MSNSIEVGGWTGTAPSGKASTEINIERKVFLQEKIKEDKERIKKELGQQKILKAELRKRTPIQYTDEVKIQVLLDLMKGKTITETSRINKVPTSTIHGWRNTYSNYPKVKTSGNTEIFKKIIIEKIEIGGNIANVAKDYGMPRRTLRDWLKKRVA
jgi:transposase-like protein